LITVICFAPSFIQAAQSQRISLSDLLLGASPITKLVLLLLLLFSVVSWAIVFSKWAVLGRADRATREFLSQFRNRSKLSDVYLDADSLKASPVARVFLAGYEEIRGQLGQSGAAAPSLETLNRVLQSVTISEVTRIEKSLSWLATTASASPFIGLFGTVVGIVIAFQGLSAATASSIQSVAPGIAEALVATAAGIAAAVPAAIFYNYFLNRVKTLTAAMDKFSLEFLNVVERHYAKAGV
jgi:biopolymer transport protein TolQ